MFDISVIAIVYCDTRNDGRDAMFLRFVFFFFALCTHSSACLLYEIILFSLDDEKKKVKLLHRDFLVAIIIVQAWFCFRYLIKCFMSVTNNITSNSKTMHATVVSVFFFFFRLFLNYFFE